MYGDQFGEFVRGGLKDSRWSWKLDTDAINIKTILHK